MLYYFHAVHTVMRIDKDIDALETQCHQTTGAEWFPLMRKLIRLKELRFEANNTLFYGRTL